MRGRSAPPPVVPRFKIGERVQIVGSPGPTVTTVVEISHHPKYPRFRTEGSPYWCFTSDLAKVPA